MNHRKSTPMDHITELEYTQWILSGDMEFKASLAHDDAVGPKSYRLQVTTYDAYGISSL